MKTNLTTLKDIARGFFAGLLLLSFPFVSIASEIGSTTQATSIVSALPIQELIIASSSQELLAELIPEPETILDQEISSSTSPALPEVIGSSTVEAVLVPEGIDEQVSLAQPPQKDILSASHVGPVKPPKPSFTAAPGVPFMQRSTHQPGVIQPPPLVRQEEIVPVPPASSTLPVLELEAGTGSTTSTTTDPEVAAPDAEIPIATTTQEVGSTTPEEKGSDTDVSPTDQASAITKPEDTIEESISAMLTPDSE